MWKERLLLSRMEMDMVGKREGEGQKGIYRHFTPRKVSQQFLGQERVVDAWVGEKAGRRGADAME